MRLPRLFALSALLMPFTFALVSADARAQAIESTCGSTQGISARPLELIVVALNGEAVAAGCREGGLESLSVTLPPGAEATLELGVMYRGERAGPLSIRTAAISEGDADDQEPEDDAAWIAAHSDTTQLQPGRLTSVSLVVDADRGLEPGSVHRIQIEFSVGDGPAQLIVPVSLKVLDDQPLFRDRFEVDPVLGQFSYRPSKTRTQRRSDRFQAAAESE